MSRPAIPAFLEVTDARMANAIRELALRHGEDTQRFALVPFGGAAGQHACAVAGLLGIDTLLLHPLAGVLSAWGIGLAQRRCIRRRSIEAPLDEEGLAVARAALDTLADDARADLLRQDVAADVIHELRTVHVRLVGSDTSIELDWADEATLRMAFRGAHERLYGFAAGDRALVIASAGAEAVEHSAPGLPAGATSSPGSAAQRQAPRVASAWAGGEVPLL